jgi:hypothetical protein
MFVAVFFVQLHPYFLEYDEVYLCTQSRRFTYCSLVSIIIIIIIIIIALYTSEDLNLRDRDAVSFGVYNYICVLLFWRDMYGRIIYPGYVTASSCDTFIFIY